MARKDIRTSGEAIPLTHHSARGNVQRNAGNFTRGSQLITHEMMMWFSGAKLPFILWFFAFAAAWFIIMSIQLDEHGFQLVVMRSEEHTSELQSLMRISYAVFCLNKKKNKNSMNI